MKPKRPVYLNVLQIRLPVPGFVSILHRASGIVLFLTLPVLLWLLSASLSSKDSFTDLQQYMAGSISLKILVWVVCSALVYHLIAGIRHLLMDIGIGESLKTARVLSYLVLMLSGAAIMGLGVWLW